VGSLAEEGCHLSFVGRVGTIKSRGSRFDDEGDVEGEGEDPLVRR
jgi:hypothetical protein